MSRPGDHVAVEWNGGPQQRPHGRQAGPSQEPTPVLVGDAPEYQLVSQFRILGVELEEVIFSRKWIVFWYEASPLTGLFLGRTADRPLTRLNGPAGLIIPSFRGFPRSA